MEEQAKGGVVTNISSVARLRYIGKAQVGYSAAKAAVIQFTKTTAVIYKAGHGYTWPDQHAIGQDVGG